MDEIEQTIAEIINVGTMEDFCEKDSFVSTPGYKSLREFASVLLYSSKEEELQNFFESNPFFLFHSLFNLGADVKAVMSKPTIGGKYYADFGLIGISQGGCQITLIELEPANVNLFTQQGTPAKRLQQAIGQVDDWQQWIRKYKVTFAEELLESAKGLPQFEAKKSFNKGWKFCNSAGLDASWRGFGGSEYARVHYFIVIGRWSKLLEKHKKRLLHYNHERDRRYTIYTYDQLARKALRRPYLDDYYI